MASRPYPSGGSLYELEFYAAVAACEGVEPGLHYYEPRGHALMPIRGLTAEVEGLLRDAAESAGIARETVQVLLIISAASPRVVLEICVDGLRARAQARRRGRSRPCIWPRPRWAWPPALGAGDSDLFARAAGTRLLCRDLRR